MSGLEFKHISHKYGETDALKDIQLTAQPGEILCLLGESGCGKTTLLNLAAGILNVQSGEIILDGQVISSAHQITPPEKRSVGLVFQDGALFPHLSLHNNIAFGISKDPKKDRIVRELLAKFGLSDMGARFPHSLSGGQQQRVAIARALAPRPAILLMDEPFASLDIVLRRRLREEIRQILKGQNCITIMVTHDPEEAMEIADKIAILKDGVIIQHATAQTLNDEPQDLFVAQLIGHGVSVRAQNSGNELISELGHWPLSCLKKLKTKPEATELDLFIPYAALKLSPAPKNQSDLAVTDIRHMGHAQILSLETSSGRQITVQTPASKKWNIADFVTLTPRAKSVISFPK